MTNNNLDRKVFSSKRGQLMIVFLFGALALLTVVALIFSIAQKKGDSDEVVKAVFAEEVRLAINSMVAVPGDAYIKLPQNGNYNVTPFTVSLYKGFVEVYKEGQSDLFTTKKGFHLPESHDARGTVKEQEAICLFKEAKNLILKECD